MHYQPAGAACSGRHELLFRIRGVHQQQVDFTPLSHFYGLTGADGYCFDDISALLLKKGYKNVKES